MITDLQRRKFSRLFQVYDYNKDGFLERSDYEQAAQGIASFLGLAPGSADMDSHMTNYMAGFEQLRQIADQDGDGRVTPDEYLGAITLMMSHPDAFEATVMSSTRDTVRWQDRDGDGRIARDEYLGVVKAYDMTQAEAEEAFGHLDRDGDGYITQEEMLKNTMEFFVSDDPQAPGNWLVGPY